LVIIEYFERIFFMHPLIQLLVFVAPLGHGQSTEAGNGSVSQFEKQIRSLGMEKAQERKQLIDAFVAGLEDQKTKLAAIDITDNRYVYSLTRDESNVLLGSMLRDKDGVVRWRALKAIGLNGLAGKHFDTVTAMAKDANPEQLSTVVFAMARSRDDRYYPRLFDFLKHTDGTIRATAVFEMSHTMPRKLIEPALAALWKDPHPGVRQDLTSYFRKDVRKVRERLKDSDRNVRETALRIIGESNHVEAAKDVAAFCDDPDAHTRGQAAATLGLLKSREHLNVLVKLLEDSDVYPRRLAVKALDQFMDTELAPKFVKMLGDSDNQVREYAVQALRELVVPEHAESVLGLLNDKDIGVRYSAATTLVRWKGAEHAKEIHQMILGLKTDERSGGWVGNGLALIREMKSKAFGPTLELLAENSYMREAAREQLRKLAEK
jgi:HEAT repeat protein